MKRIPALLSIVFFLLLLAVGLWSPKPQMPTAENALQPVGTPEVADGDSPDPMPEPPSADEADDFKSPASAPPQPHASSGPGVPPLSTPADIRLAIRMIEASTLLRADRTEVDPAEIDQVLYLRMEMTEHEVTLVSANPRPGRPKRARTAFPLASMAPALIVQATDAEGQVVWQEAIQDPTVFRCCYEHMEGAGLLTGHIEILDSASFSVRVPDVPEIETVAIYRNSRPSETLATVTVAENMIGRFAVR